jgi:hypothetical protein
VLTDVRAAEPGIDGTTSTRQRPEDARTALAHIPRAGWRLAIAGALSDCISS